MVILIPLKDSEAKIGVWVRVGLNQPDNLTVSFPPAMSEKWSHWSKLKPTGAIRYRAFRHWKTNRTHYFSLQNVRKC